MAHKQDPGKSVEAAGIITGLMGTGMSPNSIAEQLGVSSRTIYRWRDEGVTPHPSFMDRLRSMQGEKNAVHREGADQPESGSGS